VQATPGNQVELSLPSRQITAAESAYNPGANKSTTKGTTGGRRGAEGLRTPRRRRVKAGGNVIKSMRPQKPQRCGALGSSSKFSGLDRCSTISRGACSRSVPRKLHSHKRSKKSCKALVELFPETFMPSFFFASLLVSSVRWKLLIAILGVPFLLISSLYRINIKGFLLDYKETRYAIISFIGRYVARLKRHKIQTQRTIMYAGSRANEHVDAYRCV